jgi:SAM-dependent methyltransferase
MTRLAADAWTSDEAYEPYIGRWSRAVAPRFLRWLPDGPPSAWCDVGCGTGALSHAVLATESPTRVLAVDPSEGYLAAAGRSAANLETAVGTATAIPAPDRAFDRVVSALVLNFVSHPLEAIAEMRRVTEAGGVIGAYVWDYADGMHLIRRFWDAATALDPAAGDLDEGIRFPLCRPEPLGELFRRGGTGRGGGGPDRRSHRLRRLRRPVATVPGRPGTGAGVLRVTVRDASGRSPGAAAGHAPATA